MTPAATLQDAACGSGATAAGACLLCGSLRCEAVETLDVKTLVAAWRTRMQADISRDVQGIDRITRLRCRDCGLGFYLPPATASGNLYASLQDRDWFYMRDKWEFSAAMRGIPAGSRVLEVGCGVGHFLERLVRRGDVQGRGLELNANAVKQAQARGLPVSEEDVRAAAAREPGTYDVVCSFQVLEHVSDPRGFVQACSDLLKKGGRLVLTVPNDGAFMGRVPDLLSNQPPYHVTRWRRETFRHLPVLFPLSLSRMRCEPLADYHLKWFANLQLQTLPWIRYVTGPMVMAVRNVLLPAVRLTRVHKLLRGHTLYVELRRL